MNDAMTFQFPDAFANAWNLHDAEKIVSMMTRDCVMCLSSGPTKEGARFEGHEEIKAGARAVFSRMPDVQWLDAHHFIAGNPAVLPPQCNQIRYCSLSVGVSCSNVHALCCWRQHLQ